MTNWTQVLSEPSLSHQFVVSFFLRHVPLAQPSDTRFARVSGLGRTLDVKSFRQGGDNVGTYHLPEGVTHGNVVLERGVLPVSALSVLVNGAMGDFEFPRVSGALGRTVPWSLGGVSLGNALDALVILLHPVPTGHARDAARHTAGAGTGLDHPLSPSPVPLSLYNAELMPVCGWFLNDVLPVRWQTGDLDAASNAVLINTLELAYRKMTWLGVYA